MKGALFTQTACLYQISFVRFSPRNFGIQFKRGKKTIQLTEWRLLMPVCSYYD